MMSNDPYEQRIPLFPLHTVLFPEGLLLLRIFEPRYLDMVSHCLRHGHGFGICLIREGREIGQAAQVFEIGTLAEICDWDQDEDGLLGITAIGRRRFRILSQSVQKDQLIIGQVALLPDLPFVSLPPELQPLVDLLRRLIQVLGDPYTSMPVDYENARWVGDRLLELLPLPSRFKQRYLDMDEPIARLYGLVEILSHDMDAKA